MMVWPRAFVLFADEPAFPAIHFCAIAWSVLFFPASNRWITVEACLKGDFEIEYCASWQVGKEL